MSQSSRWGCLPNEIMDLVTEYCGRNYLETRWMFINKHWLNFYLSKMYHTVSIDLTSTNKIFNKILHSQFNIGKWIKCIFFENLHTPGDIYQSNKLDDPLLLLMKQTPNVKEVQFSSSHVFNASDWTYFSIVLMSNDYWKLHVLPAITEHTVIYSAHYFVCAYFLRHMLKKLEITFGTMKVSNYDLLKDFPALEVLHIGKGMVNNFADLDLILQSLPNLKGVVAKFSESPIYTLRSTPKNRYPNIVEMTLENFTPNADTEIVAFQKCFPNLIKLKIIGVKNLPWPANEVTSTTAQAFFDYLSFSSEYQITVTGKNNAASLMEKWSKWIKPIRKDSLTIEFSNDPLTTKPGNVSLTIENVKSNSAIISSHFNQSYSDGSAALESIKNSVFDLKLKQLPTDNESRLKTILEICCPILENLIFDNTFFRKLTINIKPNYVNLRSLEFYKCSFDANSFSKFTAHFHSLNFLSFNQCLFSSTGVYTTIIYMNNCNIKTMSISSLEAEMVKSRSRYYQKIGVMELFFLVSVHFVSKSTFKHYAIIEGNIIEIKNGTYEDICSKFNTSIGPLSLIEIRVKSIQTLFIKPKNGSEFSKIVF